MATPREPLISIKDAITYLVMIVGFVLSYDSGKEQDRTRITVLENKVTDLKDEIRELKTINTAILAGINETGKVNSRIMQMVENLEDYQTQLKRREK